MTARPLTRRLHLGLRHIWWPPWRRRSLFLVGGLTVGGLAVALALLSDRAQLLFQAVYQRYPQAPFLITPLGFGAIAWLTRRLFPSAQGSGIPQ
jgi:H+/Cl- antiporter ClcA